MRPATRRVATAPPASRPLGRRGPPGDTADVVALLAGDQAGFISGHHLIVDGGAAIG